jgi:hypothetical protein
MTMRIFLFALGFAVIGIPAALYLKSMNKEPEDIVWKRVCYESHVQVITIPVYNAATKTSILQTQTTVVCDAYGTVCSHHNDLGEPLCLGSPNPPS